MASWLIFACVGGALSALFYLSVMTGSMGALILGYLAPLPLFLAGLSSGAGAVLAAGVMASATVALIADGLIAAAAYILSCAVPVALVVRQALLCRTAADSGLEWYPPGRLIMGLTGYGIALLLLAAAMAASEAGGLRGAIEALLADGMAALLETAGSGAVGDARTLAAGIAPFFPAMVVSSWLVMTVINGALAQGVLMRFGYNRRPAMPLAELELPRWMPPALAVTILAAVFMPGTAGFIALNTALILVVPFFFAGLAVVHAFARARQAGLPIVLSVYLFIFVFGWPVALVVGLGVIEQWIGLRRRLAGAGPGQED